MVTEISNKNELLEVIDKEVRHLVYLISPFDEHKINTVPYKNSWTAAQLIRHITKSTIEMVKAMRKESKQADRFIGERIPDLRKIFLNFEKTLKSPVFIEPEESFYNKEVIIKELNKSFEELYESANNSNMSDLVGNLPFGSVTKLEILHFVLYHTQRHLHQLNKICDALNNITLL
jgi:hypothetical protein